VASKNLPGSCGTRNIVSRNIFHILFVYYPLTYPQPGCCADAQWLHEINAFSLSVRMPASAVENADPSIREAGLFWRADEGLV
jgi:hypothetical protein